LHGLLGRRGLELGDLGAKLRVPVAHAVDDPAPKGFVHARTSVGRVLGHGIIVLHEAAAKLLELGLAERQELADGIGMAGKGVPKRLGNAFDERAPFEVGDPWRRRRSLAVAGRRSLVAHGLGRARFRPATRWQHASQRHGKRARERLVRTRGGGIGQFACAAPRIRALSDAKTGHRRQFV
jgi:hypothetical protein